MHDKGRKDKIKKKSHLNWESNRITIGIQVEQSLTNQQSSLEESHHWNGWGIITQKDKFFLKQIISLKQIIVKIQLFIDFVYWVQSII